MSLPALELVVRSWVVLTFRAAVAAAAMEEMAGMVQGGMVLVAAAATEELVEVLTQLKMTAALVAAVDMERTVATPRQVELAVAVGMVRGGVVATGLIKALVVAADMALVETVLAIKVQREDAKVYSAEAVEVRKVRKTQESAMVGPASASSNTWSRRDKS